MAIFGLSYRPFEKTMLLDIPSPRRLCKKQQQQQQLNNRANTPSPVENKHIHLQDQNNQLQRGEKQK